MTVVSSPRLRVSVFALILGLFVDARAETLRAVLPVEVLPVDAALGAGAITSSSWKVVRPTVALQPARAARAVMLASTGKGKVLALALLGKLETTSDGNLRLDVAATSQAWCEFGIFFSSFVDCYQDLDADGKFEIQRRGILGSDEALALRRVEEPKPIPPIAYRAATDAETPKFQLGYVSCMSDDNVMPTLDSPLRFGTFINRSDDTRRADSGACKEIAKPLNATVDRERLFQFGRFKIAVRETDDGTLTTKLIEGIPAGTVLGELRSGAPLVNATELPPDAAAIAGDIPFMRMKGSAQLAAAAKPGEEMFSVQVEYGLTGRLTVAIEPRKKKQEGLVAGTPVYGIAMNSNQVSRNFDPEIVWCAPVKDAQLKRVARCAVPIFSGSFRFSETDWAPYAVNSITADGSYIEPPVIERGAVSFGAPLFLKLRYQKSDKKFVWYEWSVAPGEERVWKNMRSRRARDNAGFVLLGEAALKLAPSADGSTVSVTTEIGTFEAEAAISLPQDPVYLR